MSDHNSSPRGVAEPAIDIGDLYVFPSPDRPGRLVLAMTVFPNAQPGALFSDAASYRFSVRPVAFPAGGRGSCFYPSIALIGLAHVDGSNVAETALSEIEHRCFWPAHG